MRDVFLMFIPDDEELECFALWAFGPEYREIDEGMKFLRAWNAIHGSELTLDAAGEVYSDAEKMVSMWKRSLMRLSQFGEKP